MLIALLAKCCPCGVNCDYSDDFPYLRAYEFDTHTDGGSGALAGAIIGEGPIGSNPLTSDDDFGEAGWFTSPNRYSFDLADCIDFCDGDPVGATFDPPYGTYDADFEVASNRLYHRKTPDVYDPLGACPPPHCSGLGQFCGPGSDWIGFDTGHALYRFTPSDPDTPDITAEVVLFGDPWYAHPWDFIGPDCETEYCPNGGYREWGLHVGEPFDPADHREYGVGTSPTDAIRLCLETNDPPSVTFTPGSNQTASGFLRVWDKTGTLTEVALGTTHAALVNTGVAPSLRFFKNGTHWDVVASIGGSSTTVTGIDFSWDDGGPLTEPIPIGFYSIGGGCWSAFCVRGVDPPDDVCSICNTPTFGDAWKVPAITIDPAFYTSALGDCLAAGDCDAGDIYATEAILNPFDFTTECEWRSCQKANACDPEEPATCLEGGSSRVLKTFDDGGTPKIGLSYFWYTSDGTTATEHLLAFYEAPIGEICGPATFTKVTDNSGGTGYFPASIPNVVRVPAVADELCDLGGRADDCCPPPWPAFGTPGGTQFTFTNDWTATVLSATTAPLGYSGTFRFTEPVPEGDPIDHDIAFRIGCCLNQSFTPGFETACTINLELTYDDGTTVHIETFSPDNEVFCDSLFMSFTVPLGSLGLGNPGDEVNIIVNAP